VRRRLSLLLALLTLTFVPVTHPEVSSCRRILFRELDS
jgi:hypothetical protein